MLLSPDAVVVGHGVSQCGGRGGRVRVVSVSDPPYYDNIGYADLSDFFYVWLRRSIGRFYP
jgi:adenine-specific DNA methylase